MNSNVHPWLCWLGLLLVPMSPNVPVYMEEGSRRGTMGKGRKKGTAHLLTWLFLLPHEMRVGVLFHNVAVVLSSMIYIHDLKVSHQNLKNLRTGLKESTFLSCYSLKAPKGLSLSNLKFKGTLLSWISEEVFKVFVYLYIWEEWGREGRAEENHLHHLLNHHALGVLHILFFHWVLMRILWKGIFVIHLTDLEAEVQRD